MANYTHGPGSRLHRGYIDYSIPDHITPWPWDDRGRSACTREQIAAESGYAVRAFEAAMRGALETFWAATACERVMMTVLTVDARIAKCADAHALIPCRSVWAMARQ